MLHPNVCCRSRKIPITQSFERTTIFQLFVLHIVSLSSPCHIQCYDSLHATIFIKQSNVEISNILLEPLFPIMVLATASITGTGVASKLLGAVLSDLVVRCVSVALSFSPTTATPSLRFRCLLDGWHPQEASSSQGLGSFAVALIFYVFFYLVNFFWPDGVLSTFSRPGWEQPSHRGMPTSGAGRLGGHGDLVAYYEFLQYSTVDSLSVLQAALCILFSVPKYCISKNM
jgi:hypothetical protein